MPSAADRIDFSPPPPKGSIRAFGLALLAHILLIAALTWGVNWKTSDDAAAPFAAELWTATPLNDAVPRQPTPQPPAPEPPPVVAPPKVVETPPAPEVDIALEQEKKRKQEREQKLAADQAAKEKARKLADAEEAKAERLAKAEKAKADAKKAQEAKQVAAAKAAADAKKLQAQKDAKDAKEAQTKVADAKAAEQRRQENLKRMQGLAGATGDTDGKSDSKAGAGGRGSSRTYAAIASAAVRKNVVFLDETYGNPLVKIEVRITSDGTIMSQRIVQKSGNSAWDDAALNAFIRMKRMPRDVDGGFPDSILILEMRPRD